MHEVLQSFRDFLKENLEKNLEEQSVKRLVVGLSGGVDSVVLLDLASQISEIPVSAIHVNHKLHSRADEFEQFCLGLGKKYQVEVCSQSVEVSQEGSLEARAREARYDAFEQYLVEGDLLLLAHHADDQVETVLFRLFRGGGAFGLEGMPVERKIGKARLYRPLLAHSRADIENYAREHQLEWCEDPTNIEVGADRNFIRHNILPLIDDRFPGARKALLAGIARDDVARAELESVLVDKLKGVRRSPDCLELGALQSIEEEELVLLLTAWLADLGLPQPSGRMLQELASNIKAGNRIDMASSDLEFRELDGVVYVLFPLPETEPVDCALDSFDLSGGSLTNNTVKGKGLRVSSDYRVTLRSGGEKIRIGKNRDIKNVFQENQVPAWLRDRVPLVYAGDELVAIAALPDWQVPMLVADGWAPEPGGEGYEISISLADRVMAPK